MNGKMGVVLTVIVALACGGVVEPVDPGAEPSAQGVMVALSPLAANVAAGGLVAFAADVTGTANTDVSWSVDEGSAGGTVSSTGLYTAPAASGSFHVRVASVADTTRTATATVTVTAPSQSGVVPAFLGAEGAGAHSKGGRGGQVIKVTNLNDSGVGSLRACVSASGPRTCVFTVSGVINVAQSMPILNPYLTIAGHTAPGSGIALRTQPGFTKGGTWIFDVKTHDVVIRYLRFWGDYIANEPTGGGGGIGIAVHDPAYNLIVDHCDLLWYTAEGYDHWGTAIHNTTLQWSLVGENVSGTSGGQSTPVKMTASTYNPADMLNVDMHHNLVTTGNGRNPLLCSASARVVNNAIYNWRFYASASDNGGSADFIGNHFKPGPIEKNSNREIMMSRTGHGGSLYLASNKSEWTAVHAAATGAESDGGWALLTMGSALYQSPDGNPDEAPLGSSYRRTTPFCAYGQTQGCTPVAGTPAVAITVHPVASLQGILAGPGGVGASRRLDCNGNWVNQRDATQNRILAEFVNGTGKTAIPSSATNANGGPLPTLGGGTACPDGDGDGMPDAFETTWGLDPQNAADGAIIGPDGYSNLEQYLNGQ